MRILGIDPGLRVTGFGIIDMQGGTAHYVGSGSIRTGERTLPQRLAVIADGIKEVVEHYRPQVSAIEQVFVNVNPQSTLLLGQARGAAMLTLVQSQLEVYEYTALQVKQSVVGNGHADKKQVQSMVKRLLSLAGDPQADAADALACALCHAHHSSGLMGKFTRAGMTQRAGRLR